MGNQNPDNAPPGVPLPGSAGHGGGKTWIGLQASEAWLFPVAKDRRQLGDAMRAEKLWKVVVYGHNVLIDLAFGPNGKRTISDLDVPLIAYVPGQLTIEARPVGSSENFAADAVCFIVPVDAPGEACVRKYVAANHTFSIDAASYYAVEDSTVFVKGSGPFAVLSGARIPLAPGSRLTVGSGFEEFQT